MEEEMRVELIAAHPVHIDEDDNAEFIYVFEIEASTKVLLEMTRHREASYGCKSSRYTLNKGEVVYESTGNNKLDAILLGQLQTIELLIKTKEFTNDQLSLLLPQAYQYKWLVQMDEDSFRNFIGLRTAISAHYHIREVAKLMKKAVDEQREDT